MRVHVHTCIYVCKYVCACFCVSGCVCTHVLKLGVDAKSSPLLLATVVFETRSLLKVDAQQFGYIAQPVLAAHLFHIPHGLPLPTLELRESPRVPVY